MPRSSFKLTDKDMGWNELQNQVLKLSQTGAYVLVGVQGTEAAANHQGAPLTIGQIATVHEFGKKIVTKRGVIQIPERSFIRAAIDEYHAAIHKRATLLGTGVMLVKFTAAQALELLGQYAVGVMKQRIADGILPPNAPSTIARKKSSKPLVDKGQLRNAITYKAEGV